MAGVRKNGKAYDSGDVRVVIDGEVYDEVKELTYSTDQEHQVNHSLGNEATRWSMGKITHNASITLYMSDVLRLERKAGGSLIKLRPFDIQVSYVNDYNEIINDTLTVKFKSQGRDVTGEMGLAKQFELLALGVTYQS
ncbi:hypothetical protein D3C78_1593480 [compost metagenome]